MTIEELIIETDNYNKKETRKYNPVNFFKKQLMMPKTIF